jgi:hypothetical protein
MMNAKASFASAKAAPRASRSARLVVRAAAANAEVVRVPSASYSSAWAGGGAVAAGRATRCVSALDPMAALTADRAGLYVAA